MMSDAYFLAKFHCDTAENEPANSLQNCAKFANFADSGAPIKTFLSSQQGSKVEGLREEILRADLQKRRNNIPPETANLDRASSGP